MKKFKDWKPGEYRASIGIVTDKGTTLDFYIPHLTKTQGEDLVAFLTELFQEELIKPKNG